MAPLWQRSIRLAALAAIAIVGLAHALSGAPAAAREGVRARHAHREASSATSARHTPGVARLRTAIGALHRPRASRPAPLIVIDPGHGGLDGGTVGRSGTREKEVTLAEAEALRRELLGTGRYRVLLTRTDDRTVSLDQRLALASAHDATLLLSLHADASPNHATRGASVYIRAPEHAGPSRRPIGGPRVNRRAITRAVAASRRTASGPGSALLQSRLIASLDDDIRMTGSPNRADRLYVLANKEIPSVLVEMGFLSNRKDETLLRSPRYQGVIARAIRDALDDYFAARS